MQKQVSGMFNKGLDGICQRLTLWLVLMLLWQLNPPAAEAALVGEAELGYASYEADVNGAKSIDASSFRQRYSLLYYTDGMLADGRLGSYKVSLGYEWLSFDTKLKMATNSGPADFGSSASSGHLLYRGEVKLDPQRFPVKVRLYSFDMKQATFLSDTNTPLMSANTLIIPNITTSFHDGIRIQSGINADIGLKRSTGQQYSPIFNELPRLYVDYQDNITRDLKSLNPTNNRLRRLAFVSLNKKDNWFHVRTTNYKDFLDDSMSYKETQIILGTIDQGMDRKWVDFTNWLKLSADGQFTKHVEVADNHESYDLNLFGTATRSRWEAKTFNTFRRLVDANGITYSTRLPLYISGYSGTDTEWRARLSTEQVSVKAGNSTDTSNTLASYRIDTFKRERFTLMHSGAISHYGNSNDDKTLSLNAHLETASTRRFSSLSGLFASYDITSADNQTGTEKGNSLTQVMSIKGVYTPTSSLKMDLSEDITISQGNSAADLTNTSMSLQPSIAGSGTNSFNTPTASYIRYRTTMRVDWLPVNRLRLGFSAINDQLQVQTGRSTQASQFENSIDYTDNKFVVRLRTRYLISDESSVSSNSISADGRISYSPDRSLESSISYGYSDTSNNLNGISTATLRQSTSYYLYTDYGVSRRVLELNQALEYDRQSYSSYRQTTKSVIGGFKYYPLARLYIGARAKYSLLSYEDVAQNVYNATIGINFNLMQATIDYSYGRQSGSSNRLERRLEANLRKTF